MEYVKPMLVATVNASTMIQEGLLKGGDSPDAGEGTNSAYRSEE